MSICKTSMMEKTHCPKKIVEVEWISMIYPPTKSTHKILWSSRIDIKQLQGCWGRLCWCLQRGRGDEGRHLCNKADLAGGDGGGDDHGDDDDDDDNQGWFDWSLD